MNMMMRFAILSRNLRRQHLRGVLNNLPTTTKYNDTLARAHLNLFPSFFCTSSFDADSNLIFQIEKPTTRKYPHDNLNELPSSDGESSSSSDGEYSCSDGEYSSSDGESSYPDEKYWSLDGKWSLEHLLKTPIEQYLPLITCTVFPLAQVLSVSLHTHFDDDRPSDIYGTICATNAQGDSSNIYMRPQTNSEVIPNGGILSLNAGHNCNSFLTYSPVANTTIDLDLKDKSDNTVFIKEKHYLHSLNQDFEDTSNKLIKDIVQGEGCFAVIYYAKFLYATRAFLKVVIFSKRHKACPFVDVHGNIALVYDDQVRHMKCTLFSKTFDHPERIRLGWTMNAFRFVVAIPAYSSIIIDANISDSEGQLARGSVEVQFIGPHTKVIDGEFGAIAVILTFGTPCSEFIPEFGQAEDAQEEPSSVIDGPKKNLVPSLQQQIVTSTPSRGMRSFSSMPNNEVVDSFSNYGVLVTELFSVYVGGTNHEVSAVCGSIRVEDVAHLPECKIFERIIDNPEYFSQGKGYIPIEQHAVFDTDNGFLIDFSFADPMNGKDLCSCYDIIWFQNWALMKKPSIIVPLDKRVCSYVKGAHGYALLHYIIFKSACQAKVKITLFSNHYPLSLPVRVCGLVVGMYNNHTYTTKYEKKYYQSRLFYKPRPEFVELESDMSVPLSKSAVAIPEGVGLVVEVDMEVLSSSGNQKDIVFGKKVFNINMSRTTHAEILGKYYGVRVSTKFMFCS